MQKQKNNESVNSRKKVKCGITTCIHCVVNTCVLESCELQERIFLQEE
ncbi:hypothetical protein SAMN05192546_101118 [Tindallia californiensis]|uniref:Uncharacterized protein n=1 Tax=Tindallia californiensis TaxID=159292 RepID=A0A1H3IET6_9FIRM|nr:hypothetical protein SAMN05192546_101118 [Tindallia californiensis]